MVTQKHRSTKQMGNKRTKQTKRQEYLRVQSKPQDRGVKNRVTMRQKHKSTEQTQTQYKENNKWQEYIYRHYDKTKIKTQECKKLEPKKKECKRLADKNKNYNLIQNIKKERLYCFIVTLSILLPRLPNIVFLSAWLQLTSVIFFFIIHPSCANFEQKIITMKLDTLHFLFAGIRNGRKT